MSTPTCETEFTNHFKQYFENPSLDLEKKKVPFIPPSDSGATTNAFKHTDSVGSTLLLDINPVHDSSLYHFIENDFLNHTRDRREYSVESIRVLRNIKIWKRYQAEKQIQRDSAEEERNSRNQSRTPSNPNPQPSYLEEEDPGKLFKDEVLYHGTLSNRVPSILLNGLDPKLTIRANYGKGVYFSDSVEKCMQYVDKQGSLDQTYSVILCCVLLGRVLVEPHTKSQRHLGQSSAFLPEGYNSAVAHDLFKEWIVFEKTQILPLCVINFKTTNRPESATRLTSYSTLLQGTDSFPPSMNGIQRFCTVSSPKDASTREAIEAAMKWRDPDPETERMLNIAFNITNGQTKVCNISIDSVVKSVPTGHMCVINEKNMTSLKSLSKNVQTLTDRLEQHIRNASTRWGQHRLQIEQDLPSIPDADKLIALLEKLEPEMKRIEIVGVAVNEQIEQIKHQLIQSGREDMINTHDFQLAIHPYKKQFEELKAQYDENQKAFSAWNQQHINIAQNIRRKQQEFATLIASDKDSEKRQRESIQIEMDNIRSLAQFCITHINEEELIKRQNKVKEERERSNLSGEKKALQMELVKIDLTTVQIWPQIVAEVLMPAILIKQLKHDHARILDTTKPNSRMAGIKDLGIRDVSESWHIAPMNIFGAPAATSYFWPLDPRHRLPNREFMQFQDYIVWMIAEKIIRGRKQHRSRYSSLINPVPKQQIQSQLDGLDPTIIRSIQGLSSRFGTVVFNRQDRQKELDRMGTDMLSKLYVEAQQHMLDRGAECPICQENLTVSGHGGTNNPIHSLNIPEIERVIKLKSCRHCFHELCISAWFNSKDSQLKCPMCNVMCTTKAMSGTTKKVISGGAMKLGPMPDGVMGYSFDARLSCYFIYITIPAHTISNSDPSINQGQNIFIGADIRFAIVPFSARLGPLLMIRLISAFYYGHLFRVGQSISRGVNNVVVWNGIHLRTAMTGEYGFPAPNFESNCWDEINQKGIALGLDDLVLNMPLPNGAPIQRENTNIQQTVGVDLPSEVLEELTEQENVIKMFSIHEPLLFGATY